MANKPLFSVPRSGLLTTLVCVMIALAVIVLSSPTSDVVSQAKAHFESPLFYSPLPKPTPQPVVPTPSPKPSQPAQEALLHLAKREGIPVEALQVVDDHPTEYPNLGRQFQVVTIVDTRPQGQIYKLLVDLKSGRIEEDISGLLAAEARAYQERYGKLQPVLFERLQAIGDDEALPVAVWVTSPTGQSLTDLQKMAFDDLAAKYPEVREAREHLGKPMDVPDPERRRKIEDEYLVFLAVKAEARVLPLVRELENKGFSVTTIAGTPSFTAVLHFLELSLRLFTTTQ
ncbi:MAG: hypothetical protein ACP5ON_11345 [Bacteroidota bacterium]